jgi:hypothetical protein
LDDRSKGGQGVTPQVPLRSKLLFALCIACPLLPFAAWAFLLTTICSNPRTPDPETQHVTAYSCHGMTVFISDLESALLHWIIPIGGVLFILLGILAGVAAVLSMSSIQVDVKIKVMDASCEDSSRER